VKSGKVAAVDDLPPTVQVPLVRLAGHVVAEAVEVAQDRRSPVVEALAVEQCGEPP